ncbi:hypothetical protein E4U43_005713 [Claviceps pusilla]|uniref:SAP domain-containing protein n=1 Tax=Claviceps pusilla TaxID=123648 RepID=A0A9P7T030_9HYPO|nr:hypothetical protein E4U43_005713 [Claviceps pusilla]
MSETVDAFSKARTPALTLARASNSGSALFKRKKSGHDIHEPPPSERQKRRRTSARLSSQKKNDYRDKSPITSQQVESSATSDEDEHSDDRNAKSRSSYVDDMVPCPSCQKHMKAWQVFRHLEACPGPNAESGSSNSMISLQQQVQQRKSITRLPALNYSILKEQALRKKLSELGISNQGPRTLLEKRHKEWINLWNANCDAANPKKRSQLLQDLDVWEKTQGYRSPAAGPATLNVTMIKDKNFDGARWAAKHDSSFKDLIASARKNITRTNKLVKNEGEGGSDDEDEDESGKQTNGQQLVQQIEAHPQELPNHVNSAEDAYLNSGQEAEGEES